MLSVNVTHFLGKKVLQSCWITDKFGLLFSATSPLSTPIKLPHQITRRTLSQFWSFEIRRTTFLNYLKFVDTRNLRLLNCERTRREGDKLPESEPHCFPDTGAATLLEWWQIVVASYLTKAFTIIEASTSPRFNVDLKWRWGSKIIKYMIR